MNEYLISVEGMKVINEQIVSAIIARWNEVIDAIRSDDSFYSEQLKERYVDKLVDDMKEWMMYGYIRVVAKDEELTFIPVIVNEITEVASNTQKIMSYANLKGGVWYGNHGNCKKRLKKLKKRN